MTPSVVARTLPLEGGFDPLASVARGDELVWARGERALVAWGEFARIEPGGGDGRFRRAARELGRLFERMRIDDRVNAWATGPLAFGGFAFDPDSAASSILVPEVIAGRDGRRAWVTAIGARDDVLLSSAGPPLGPPAAVRRTGSSVDDARWLAAVAAARAAVADGIVDKVVLARDELVAGERAFDVPRVVQGLARDYPGCFTFSFAGMVGATPELLVRRAGREVTSEVLGGTAARGEDGHADRGLGDALLRSGKDRREHDLAVATVREGLERICRRVTVDEQPSLLRLSYAQHLRTRVEGSLGADLSALELVGALHPTAAVCGVPTDKALAAIRELEGLDRGRYCGPVGWVDARGDGEWGIALRCAEIAGARARLFAGAGIVADSDPVAELAEVELKLRPLLRALGAIA